MKISVVLEALTGSFITDTDRASKQFQRRMKDMERQARLVGAAIGTALVGGVALYVKNTIEAEKVQKQLTARIRDTGMAAGRTLAQLNAQAEKLQRATIFDDESIGEAQAALLTFTQVTGEQFDRAIETATDLATVMGTDVPEAAKLLGKALADPEKGMLALRRAGVVLTDDQKDLIKNLQDVGDIAGAQTVILDALAEKMGTAAEASRDTLGGALQALGNSFNELLEGNSGDDGMLAAREALEDLNDSLNDPAVKQGFDSLVSLMANAAQVAVTTTSAIANLAMGIDAFGRSAAQAKYDAGLAKEQQLKDEIAAGGRSPFAAGGGRTVATLQAELAAQKRENAAHRARLSQAPVAGSPAAAADPSRVTIHANPSLFGVPEEKATKATKALTDAKRAAAEAAREQAEREADLRDALEKVRVASEDFAVQLQDLRDEGDPLAQAQTEYNRNLKDLQELAAEGEVSTLDLAEAERLLREQYEKNTQAIKDRLDTGGQQLEQMQRELDLMNMQTRAERVRAQFLMDNETATDAQADAAVRIDEQMEETRQAISLADEARASFEDTFVNVFEDGIKSAEDFGEAIVKMLLRIEAQRLSMQLFGEAGTTGGGLFGGILSSLFGGGGGSSTGGSLAAALDTTFSNWPGFALGGDPPVGKPYWVGEDGPELHIDRTPSTIVPRSKLGMAGGFTQIINNTYRAPTDPRTREQIAKDMAREASLSTARNGR